MAEDDSNLKIGIGLDTSKLPGEARRAERTIREAVEGATDAVEQQGRAAEQTAKAHAEAATQTATAQQQTAAAVKQTTAAVKEQQNAAGQAVQQTASSAAESIGKTTTAAGSGIEQVSKSGSKSVEELAQRIDKGKEAVGGFTTALNVANGVMGVLSKTFAVIGLINQVATSVQLVMDLWKKMNAEAVSAGQKFAASWRQQREEARKLRDQNAALEALKAQEAAHDSILKKMREQHAFQAEMRAMEARRTGNRDEMKKATLDGMLARGEITEAEHIDGTRAVDDAARERRQADELKGPLEKLAEAEQNRSNNESELFKATQSLASLESYGAHIGHQQYFGMASLEKAAIDWANRTEELDKMDSMFNLNSEEDKESVRRQQQSAEIFIQKAADLLHVSRTKDGKELSMKEWVDEIKRVWQEQREGLRGNITKNQNELDKANTEVEQAQAVVNAMRGVHEAEDAKVQEGYRQEDMTLAWSANRAATEANTEAKRAETEATREGQREQLEQRHTAATDAAEAARSTYSTSWAMEQERATAEQATAMAAINRLLTRGEKEPRALEQLLAMLSGQEVTLTEDEARRYGTDFQLAKNGALTGEQQAAISTVVQQLMTALQAEATAKQVGEEVDAFNQQDAAATRAAQDAEVERLRAEAEEARARADEATARLQRYNGGQPAATTPPQGAAPAVPMTPPTGAAPMPPVDEALRAAGDVVAQHNDLANAVMGAMGQFNATTTAAVAAIGTQRGQLAKLTAESNAMQQQLANLARANV